MRDRPTTRCRNAGLRTDSLRLPGNRSDRQPYVRRVRPNPTLMRSLVLAAVVLAPSLRAQAPGATACASPPSPATAQPATIPIDVYSNHVYVKVCADDRPLDFILDTGAGATFLDLHTAERFGVKLGGSVTGGGAGAGTIAGGQL